MFLNLYTISRICFRRHTILYKEQTINLRILYASYGSDKFVERRNFNKNLLEYKQPMFHHIYHFGTESQMKNSEIKSKQSGPETIKVKISSKKDKLKKAVKEYGSTVIVFHIGISLISLGTFYILVSLGLDTAAIFSKLGYNDWASTSKIATNAGNFAVAYAIHKMFAPVRIGITLASVPFIVRYLKKIRFLK